MRDRPILIGNWRVLDVVEEGKWVDGEWVEGVKIGEFRCIVNPMSSEFLKNFESGQYTTQDQVAYSYDYVKKWKNGIVFITDKRGVPIKYTIDDVKEWDDSDLVKYLLKRVLDGQ